MLIRLLIALAWILAIAAGLAGVLAAIVPILLGCLAIETWRSWRQA